MKKIKNINAILGSGPHCIEGGYKKIITSKNIVGGPAFRWNH